MKRSIYVILLFLIIYSVRSQSSCLPNGIVFENQSEIDNFQYNYPGCTEIEGDVEITGYLIDNLEGLSVLTSIGGSLDIHGLSFVPLSLQGLNNLTTIGGDLYISNNDSLIDLSGLDNLLSIKKNITIRGNNSLLNLSGLENLSSVGDNIRITNNISLTSLSGLGDINVTLVDDLYIHGNSMLSECEIETICNYLILSNGSINIYNNASGCNYPIEVANACDTTLSCLPNGNYYFLSQYDIDMCSVHYPGCTELKGIIKISGDDINNLSGLDGITSINGTFKISGNPNLSTLTGLDNVGSMDGSFTIVNNGQLTSLNGLENLTGVSGVLKIKNNPVLSSITGLGSLENVGEEIHLLNNPGLNSLSGLEGLTSVGGGINIADMDGLTELTGLNNITTVGRYLVIAYCSSLINLDALENLTYVGWWLSILNNYSLESISGLSNLLSTSGSLSIEDNPNLLSLEGLNNLDPNNIQTLRIYENFSLTTCEVESICDYLLYNFGPVNIHDNASGCNSQEEVEEACESVPVGSINPDGEISIFPNPANRELTISSNDRTTIEEIIIYNQAGQKVLYAKPGNKIIDISQLQPGMYIIEVVSGQRKIREKLMIE